MLLRLTLLAMVAPGMAAPHPHLLFLDRHHLESADPRLSLRVQEPARGPLVLTPTEPWEAHEISAFTTVVAGVGTRPHRMYYSTPRPPPP
eukprot:COSAG04_NODE_2672_length_3756_cov_3.165983_3_plen_89_part_01